MKKDLLIILLLILPAISPLFQKGYFAMHDDLQSMRQYEMERCFADGQIPCRWVNDMGYGYGYPLFNYYPPLPYLLGQVYRWLGFTYIDVVKLVGITGFIATAFFMYGLARDLWGRRGGVVSSLLYTYAPYHSVDFYVRGAMNEFWAMCFYPAIFWMTLRLIKTKSSKYVIFLGLSFAGLMLSHNPMLMIFTPLYLLWISFYWLKARSFSSFPKLMLSGILAFGLAAFFTLPVVFEQRYAHVETLVIGYFNYLAHFVPINRMFLIINWGYGASNLGQTDKLSFNIGYLHWLLPLFALSVFALTPRLRKYLPLLTFLVIGLLGALFMMHSKSSFIWQAIKPLEFLQFPWRFLTVAAFCASVAGGAIGRINLHKPIIFSLLTLILLLNANFFQPRLWYPDMTDAKKFSGEYWHMLVTSGIFDYLPIYAPMPPADPAGGDVNMSHGTGQTLRLKRTSNLQHYRIDVSTPTATAELQTYYFPGWKVWVNGQEQPIDPHRDPLLGRIQVDLSLGKNDVIAKFTNTPIRTLGNFITGLSIFMLFVLLGKFIISRSSKSQSGKT